MSSDFSSTIKEQLSVLDTLTGCPIPEDILVYAIPVCAPYSAILNYKYARVLYFVFVHVQ